MQQVNLFTDAFKPPKVKLPLEQIIVFPMLTVVLLVALSLILNSYVDSKRQELSELTDKNLAMAERLKELNQKADKHRQDESLVAANARLKETLDAREAMLSTLDRVFLGESVGFSETLIALARQHQSGLWLTAIRLGGQTQEMLLQGVTTKAELVPAYLQNLRQESTFVGRHFSLFELNDLAAESDSGSGAQNAAYAPTWLGFTLKAEQQNRGLSPGLEPGGIQSLSASSSMNVSLVEGRP